MGITLRYIQTISDYSLSSNPMYLVLSEIFDSMYSNIKLRQNVFGKFWSETCFSIFELYFCLASHLFVSENRTNEHLLFTVHYLIYLPSKNDRNFMWQLDEYTFMPLNDYHGDRKWRMNWMQIQVNDHIEKCFRSWKVVWNL